MNTTKRIILILFLTLEISLSGGICQDSVTSVKLTFDQAWELTSQNNHAIKQVDWLKHEKDLAVKAAKGLYMPKIGITGTYMLMADDISLNLTSVKDIITPLYQYGTFSGVPNPDPATNKIQPVLPDNLSTQAVRTEGLQAIQNGDWDPVIQKKLFGTLDATFQWPIYTGGKISAANKSAKIEQNEASELSRQKIGEIQSELVERYYGLILAKKALNVRIQVLSGMEQHLSDVQKMHAQGFIANSDVLHAEVFKAQAFRELLKARRNVETINQALLNTLSLPGDTTIEPISQLFYLDTIESLESFKILARTKNPMLLQVDQKKLLSQQNYSVQKAQYFPTIAIEGMYDIINKDLSPYIPEWTVGIGLNWTIFDGASRLRKVQSASMKTEEVEEIKLKAELDITTVITRLYNELNMYHEQLIELESAKTYNDEYLRDMEKSFHDEMSNVTEVVDANLALAQVRIERLQAMYNYDLTLARLLQYAGIPENFDVYSQKISVHFEN
jgi:outer membrane protein TolC